jgi:hypothetical protein
MHNDGFNKVCLFQKRVRDDRGTRYFVDVYEYDWLYLRPADLPRFSYEAQVHFYTGDGDSMLKCTIQDDGAMTSPEALEEFVTDLYSKIGAGHYELNAY